MDAICEFTMAVSSFEVIKNTERIIMDLTSPTIDKSAQELTVEIIPMDHNIWKCHDEGYANNSWVYNYLVWIKVGRLPLAVTLPDILPAKTRNVDIILSIRIQQILMDQYSQILTNFNIHKSQ